MVNDVFAIDAREVQQKKEQSAKAYNPIETPSAYNPGSSSNTSGSDKLKDMANIVIGAIQIIGNVLSVAVLGILGIKYMLGSAEERAEYKKSLRPYLIGAIMVFGITNILAIVIKIAGQIQVIV